MELRKLASYIALILLVLAAINFDFTKQTIARWRDFLPKEPEAAPSMSPVAAASSAERDTRSAVESYMRLHASPQCAFLFLDWSDFSTDGNGSAITLRYSAQKPSQAAILASIRFSLQAGSVVKAELVGHGSQTAHAPPTRAPQRPTRPPVVVDHFSGPIFSAMHASNWTLHLDSAFSLPQLEQAKAKARSQRKPLGFLLVWGKLFDNEVGPRDKYSDSALLHFYDVFNQGLVLVFVRHETELGMVPPAVRQGFMGPNEGGFAPNMAVTDASASEFIVEIPFKGLDGSGRDELFAAGGKQIDQWLATHPDAMATPVAKE